MGTNCLQYRYASIFEDTSRITELSMRIPPLVVFVLIFGVLIISSAVSFPKLAVEQGTTGVKCHVNPNGGRARNEYGNHAVGFNEFCRPSTK